MFGAFDMPFEVTISELAIELLFPADQTIADCPLNIAAVELNSNSSPMALRHPTPLTPRE